DPELRLAHESGHLGDVAVLVVEEPGAVLLGVGAAQGPEALDAHGADARRTIEVAIGQGDPRVSGRVDPTDPRFCLMGQPLEGAIPYDHGTTPGREKVRPPRDGRTLLVLRYSSTA